jgi:uncharacterized RDD family membrane protein YckC
VPETGDAPAFAGPQLVTEPATPGSGEYSHQASLFGPQEVLTSPEAVQPSGVRAERKRQSRTRREQPVQHSLDFAFTIPEGVRTVAAPAEAAVFCDAPVAIPTHRALAAALDLAIPAAGFAVFLTTLHYAGGGVVLTRQAIWVYGAVLLLITVLYRLLFCIAETDTPGLQWTGLRLLNFDGRRPTRQQRLNRIVGGFVSVISSGIGLVWALFDEERLTWHDYMSKTFPSPRGF